MDISGNQPVFGDTKGVTPAEFDTTVQHTPAPNVEAPVFGLEDVVTPDLAAKIEYLYEVARKVESIIDQVTPQQIERTKGLMGNPLLQKMFGG